MNPDHLLDLARQIIQLGAGKPRQVMLKRAVSTGYYALFHALSQDCVDRTVGAGFRSPRFWQIATPLYRSIDHGSARRVFERLVKDGSVPVALRQVGRSFLELQAARIAADYDPGKRFTRAEALDMVGQAGGAVEALRSVPYEDRLVLVVQFMSKQR